MERLPQAYCADSTPTFNVQNFFHKHAEVLGLPKVLLTNATAFMATGLCLLSWARYPQVDPDPNPT